jgi:hypothetical protein
MAYEVIEEKGFEDVSVNDLGDTITLSQIDDYDSLHQIILGSKQILELRKILNKRDD